MGYIDLYIENPQDYIQNYIILILYITYIIYKHYN